MINKVNIESYSYYELRFIYLHYEEKIALVDEIFLSSKKPVNYLLAI